MSALIRNAGAPVGSGPVWPGGPSGTSLWILVGFSAVVLVGSVMMSGKKR